MLSISISLIVLTVMAAILPAVFHLGALRGSPLTPPADTQSSEVERLIFRRLPLLFMLNGALAGAVVFLAKTGSELMAVVAGILALPSVVAQLVALTIAKARDVASAGRRSARVR